MLPRGVGGCAVPMCFFSSSFFSRILRRNKLKWIQDGSFSRLNRLVEL